MEASVLFQISVSVTLGCDAVNQMRKCRRQGKCWEHEWVLF